MWLYSMAKALLSFVTGILWRKEVKGNLQFPEGGFLLCSNHFSNWDPVILACSFPRQVHFMGKEELFANSLMNKLLLKLGMVKVKRGMSDRKAMREIINYLSSGEVCGLFPEGHRSEDGELQGFFSGAVYLAIKGGVPILPAAIKGDYHKKGSKIVVKFGEPIVIPKGSDADKDVLEYWTKELSLQITQLLEEN